MGAPRRAVLRLSSTHGGGRPGAEAVEPDAEAEQQDAPAADGRPSRPGYVEPAVRCLAPHLGGHLAPRDRGGLVLPGVDRSAPGGAGEHGKEFVVCLHRELADGVDPERLINRLGLCIRPDQPHMCADLKARRVVELAAAPLLANLGTLGVVGAPSRMPTSSELRFVMKSGATPAPHSAVTKVLADRLTREGQQALRRCRSHSPSGHQPEHTHLFPDGRNGAVSSRPRQAGAKPAPFRPNQQRRRCRGGWLLSHASERQLRLQLAADRIDSKQIGEPWEPALGRGSRSAGPTVLLESAVRCRTCGFAGASMRASESHAGDASGELAGLCSSGGSLMVTGG
jgi:hypothetical protein